MSPPGNIDVLWLGRVPYEPTWELQERLRQRVIAGGAEALLLCEHEPVITLGRGADAGHVLVPEAVLQGAQVALVRSNRGGQVTYHGPGQLVAYPIRRLRHGVVEHVSALGQGAVAVAAALGVAAEFRREPVGVFVGARKLAAMGVHVQRRVTVHGMALNVGAAATASFGRGWFNPCGQAFGSAGSQVISLAEASGRALEVVEVVAPLARALCAAFGWPAAEPRSVGLRDDSLLSTLPFVK